MKRAMQIYFTNFEKIANGEFHPQESFLQKRVRMQTTKKIPVQAGMNFKLKNT